MTDVCTMCGDSGVGHYAWEVEPFDPEGPVGIVISMADVECGQPLDATLVVLADSDDEREVEWARSTADDIAARLNEHQAQAATIAELQREIEGYRQALEKAKAEAVAWEGALEEWKEGSIRAQTELRTALRETRDQLQRDFAIRCRCDFVTKLPAGIERCVGCRARDRIDAIDLVLAVEESARD